MGYTKLRSETSYGTRTVPLITHNTAQEMTAVGLAPATSVETSVHYRRHNAAGLTEHYDFPILLQRVVTKEATMPSV